MATTAQIAKIYAKNRRVEIFALFNPVALNFGGKNHKRIT